MPDTSAVPAIDRCDCLLLGASGAIGRFLLPRLLAEGRRPLAISRQAVDQAARHGPWLTGDLHGSMPDLSGLALETVFSAGPLDAFAAWLEKSPLPALRGVVAISSMSAVVKASSPDPAERELSRRLLAAEQSLRDECARRRVGVVILRPTLIYGSGVDQSLAALARFGRRWRLFPSIPGAHGLRQPVHADDVAAACVAASRLPARNASPYSLGGGERLSFGAMLEHVRQGLPVRTLPVRIPLGVAAFALHCLRLLPRWRHLRPGLLTRLQSDLVVDLAPAQRDLEWTPRRFHSGADGGF